MVEKGSIVDLHIDEAMNRLKDEYNRIMSEKLRLNYLGMLAFLHYLKVLIAHQYSSKN